MIQVRKGRLQDLEEIRRVALEAWQATYTSIISAAQIDFMLNRFYHPEILSAQMNDPEHHFYMLEDAGKVCGYAHCYPEADAMKLSKIYFYTAAKGKGYGKILIEYCEQEAVQLGYGRMILNVNRHNPAQHFYLKMGYQILEEVDIPLDVYWLNDYVMGKELHQH